LGKAGVSAVVNIIPVSYYFTGSMAFAYNRLHI